jgi:elongation factor 1 alpha-like protein
VNILTGFLATTTQPQKASNATAPSKDLSNGVAKMSIQEPAKVKSKNLDVAAEYKKNKRKNAANFVVIGMSFSSAKSRR